MNIDDWTECQFCRLQYPVEEGRRCECPEGEVSDRDVVAQDPRDARIAELERQLTHARDEALEEAAGMAQTMRLDEDGDGIMPAVRRYANVHGEAIVDAIQALRGGR